MRSIALLTVSSLALAACSGDPQSPPTGGTPAADDHRLLMIRLMGPR